MAQSIQFEMSLKKISFKKTVFMLDHLKYCEALVGQTDDSYSNLNKKVVLL